MAEKVKAKDTVTVYATGNGKNLKQVGRAVKVHKIVADKLVARGLASFEKPKEGKSNKSEKA
jgi:hypothetical protein